MMNKVWLPLVGIIVVSTVMTATGKTAHGKLKDAGKHPAGQLNKKASKHPEEQLNEITGKPLAGNKITVTETPSKPSGSNSSSPSISHCDDLVVYELRGLVRVLLKDPNNEDHKNRIREIVNDHIRTYKRPMDGEGYANYIHICCFPLEGNKVTRGFASEIWSALDQGKQMTND
jgi:hypothetical protein